MKILKHPNHLSVCSYQEFEPVIYGDGKGFEADILRAVAKLWEKEIIFHTEKKYSNIWEAPLFKDCDLAAGGISPQAGRKTHTIFSLPTAYFCQSLLVRRKDYLEGKIEGYNSFLNSNYIIGVIKDSTGEKYGHSQAEALGIDFNIFKQYPTESELLSALLSTEIAAIARGEIGNEFQVSKNKDLITIAKKNYGESFCYAVDSADEAFLIELNKAIQCVTNFGKITYKEWNKDNNIFMNHPGL